MGTAVAVIGALGGCRQIIGYEDPTVIDGGLDAAQCADGKKDGSETDTDCGGSTCAPCRDGKGCGNGADCASKVCSTGTCLAPACGDKVKNGSETDADCGGATCPACGPGKSCAGDGDCAGSSCKAHVCAVTCTDMAKNGKETDVDCGGGCPGCAIGKACVTGTDCATGVCKSGACKDFDVWSKRFGDSSYQLATALVVDNFGQVVLTGTAGSVDFGGGTLTSGASQGIFAAKLDGAGGHLWSKLFNKGNPEDVAGGIAIASFGDVMLTGRCAGTIDFGNGPIVGGNLPGIYFAQVFPSGGASSGKRPGRGAGTSIATGPLGQVASTGLFLASADFGQGPLTSTGGADVFVTKTGGNFADWSKRFGDASEQSGESIAVDNSGNVLVAGSFQGSIDFGGGALTATGSGDTFLVKLDGKGNQVWSKQIGSPISPSIAVDSAGNVVLVGTLAGTVDLGGGALTSAGGNDVLVAKLDPGGAHLWSKRFGDAGDQSPTSVSIDPVGNIIVAGGLTGPIDFGGGSLASVGKSDIFIAKLDGAGAYLWARSFGGVQTTCTVKAAAAGTENVVLVGSFDGQVDLGGGLLTTMGGVDIFVAKFLVP